MIMKTFFFINSTEGNCNGNDNDIRECQNIIIISVILSYIILKKMKTKTLNKISLLS